MMLIKKAPDVLCLEELEMIDKKPYCQTHKAVLLATNLCSKSVFNTANFVSISFVNSQYVNFNTVQVQISATTWVNVE